MINIYAKKYNIPVDQAKAILQPILSKKDRLKDLEEFMSRVESMKPVINTLPEDARTPISLLLARELLSSSSKTQNTTDLVIVKELLKGLREEDPEVRKLADEVRALKDMIIEERTKKSLIDEFRNEISSIRKEIEELRNRMAQPAAPQEKRGELDELMRKIEDRFKYIEDRLNQLQKPQPEFKSLITQALKDLKETVQLAKEYGLVRESGGDGTRQLSPEEMAEILKKYGYDVRKATISPEEFEKIKERIWEEARREVERELEVEKARIESAASIIRDLIKEVGGPVIKSITEAQKDYAKELLMRRLQQLQSMQYQQPQIPQQPQQPQQQVQQVEVSKSAGSGEQGGSVEGGKPNKEAS
jgi:hypothetical protein